MTTKICALAVAALAVTALPRRGPFEATTPNPPSGSSSARPRR